jgi:hypothetical protein
VRAFGIGPDPSFPALNFHCVSRAGVERPVHSWLKDSTCLFCDLSRGEVTTEKGQALFKRRVSHRLKFAFKTGRPQGEK